LENGNSVLALDFNFDGSLFATGGKDFHVLYIYIYNIIGKKIIILEFKLIIKNKDSRV